jgi:hypothetical protein
MLRRGVGVVEGVRVSLRGFVAPVGVFTAHHVTAIDVLVLVGLLAVLELLVDAAVEEPFVAAALDARGVLAVDVDGGYDRQLERRRELHAEMRVAQFVLAVAGGIGWLGEIPLNVGRKLRPWRSQVAAQESRVESAAIGEIIGSVQTVGDGFRCCGGLGIGADRHQRAREQILDRRDADGAVLNAVNAGKMQADRRLLIEAHQRRAGISAQRRAVVA